MINEKNAKKYCKEDISKIENYYKAIADTTQVWHCHHRTKIWWNCTTQDLIDNECYYGRKACELIFLTEAEHAAVHLKGNSYMLGKHHTEETRKKMSNVAKGRLPWNTGKHHSDETRKKIGEKSRGRKSTLGKTWQTSKFGKGFYEHYNIRRADNIKLYDKEKHYFYKYGHFSWELNNVHTIFESR